MGLAAVLALGGLAVVCGSMTAWGAGAPSPRDAQDTVTMVVINVNYRVALEEIAARYEERHPGVRVEVTTVGQGYETWIRTRFAAGGALVPDIFNVNYISNAAERGRIIFFDEYLPQISPYTGVPWQDSFDMRLMQRYQWAGHTTLIPLDYTETGLFYNQDIFDSLGLRPPSTWEELLTNCEALRDAGYIPMAASGDSYSFWLGTVGCLVMLFGDAYLRDLVPAVAARPGDWDYIAERNAGFVYDPADPYGDLAVVVNPERTLNAILDGTIDFQSPRFQHMYRKLKQLAQFWQPGYMGSDTGGSMQLFYQQKAAMCVMGSASVTGIVRDFEEMAPEQRFRFGVSWFPPIRDDPLVCGPFRGLGGVATMLGVTKKDDAEHERRVVDFLMYLTSPESVQFLVRRTVEEGQPLNGPMVVKGVELPPSLQGKYSAFLDHGFEKLRFRGLLDEQESVARWVMIAQEHFSGRMSQEDFLRGYKKIMQDAAGRVARSRGYDMDPATRDTVAASTVDSRRRQKQAQVWNPFLNGSLALALILGGFAAFAALHVLRVRGIQRRRTATAYALLMPMFVLLASFGYFPAFSGLYYAFTDWQEGGPPLFSGFANFRRMAADHVFWEGMGNMAILLLTGIIKATIIPFAAAEMILALSSAKLRYTFRSSFLIPLVVPGMVGILLWRFVYDPNIGLLNQLLSSLGLEGWQRGWLGDAHLALPAYICVGFPWVGAIGLLIYLAGLLNVPGTVYDAYRLESQSIWRRLWHLDWPLVRGQTRLLVVLTFIGSIQDFQGIYIMTGGGPGTATAVPALWMFYHAFKFSNFGYGAALGFVLFLMILGATIVNLRLMRPAEEME